MVHSTPLVVQACANRDHDKTTTVTQKIAARKFLQLSAFRPCGCLVCRTGAPGSGSPLLEPPISSTEA